MNFRAILRQITKGDMPGHDFHGNQWVSEGGGFAVRQGGGRRGGGQQPDAAAAAAARLQAAMANNPFGLSPATPPATPPPAPSSVSSATPPPEPSTVSVSDKAAGQVVAGQFLGDPKVVGGEPGNFRGLGSDQIVSSPEDVSYGAGNQLKSLAIVEMGDGKSGLIKEIDSWHDGTTGAELAENEVLASKIGAAINAPLRSALPVDGRPDSVVQTLLDGTTPYKLGSGMSPFDDPADIKNLAPDVRQQIAEIKFMNAMVGNGDDHWKNWMITGANESADWGRDGRNALVPGTQVTGIDYSLAFRSSFPPSSYTLQAEQKSWGISDERISGMMQGLNGLASSGTLNSSEADKVNTLITKMNQAFPHLVKP